MPFAFLSDAFIHACSGLASSVLQPGTQRHHMAAHQQPSCRVDAGMMMTVFVPEASGMDLEESSLFATSSFGKALESCGYHQVWMINQCHIVTRLDHARQILLQS